MFFLDRSLLHAHGQIHALMFRQVSSHVCTNRRAAGWSSVFHGVPEAPCVGPKYYTQTVAIASKPKIPHSTFLIPVARLLSWAPHEEPLLERAGSCISLCLSLCLSVCLYPSFPLSVCPSAHIYLILVVSMCDCIPFLSLRCFILSFSHSLSPPLALGRPLSHSLFLPSCICLFLPTPRSAPRLPPMPLVCGPPSLSQDFYLAVSFVSLSHSLSLSPSMYPAVCLSVSLSLCVSRYSCRDFLTCEI